jgi:gliding motility-associated-like protein
MNKMLYILFVFVYVNSFAQFSKTHYIPPLSTSLAVNVLPQNHFLYISTPSLTPVKVTIEAIGVGLTNVTVSQNNPVSYFIGFGPNTQLMASPDLLNKPLSNKGYIVEAESLVYVAARVSAGTNDIQAGSLVSKGISALGKEFRVGAFVNTATTNTSTVRYTFLSILATENNTTIEFKDIKPGVTLLNNAIEGNTPKNILLNRGQSYTLATDDSSLANKDGLIGALVKSDKPIAFNCGSFGGTNGEINGNFDIGFDQVVPIENIKNKNSQESEYIFVRGFGLDITERPLLVAHEDNTEIFINEVSTTILNAGQYLAINGAIYGSKGNMYVRTTKPTFAFQSVGGPTQPNQEMFFVPPLNCATPKIVNNIPFIEKIGTINYTTNSGLNVVTEAGAAVQIGINGLNYPIFSLPSGVTVSKKASVKAAFDIYQITGLRGNIGVFSNKQVYVSYFGASGSATYGGYYSGFDLKPEIISEINLGTTSNCIPNLELKISAISAYDDFQWIFNDTAILNSNTNFLIPTKPGYYQVRGNISGCTATVLSDKIPVSSCPTNLDNDKANDNIDIDNDGDGILNCTESYGNQNINLSNLNEGNIAIGAYSNSYIATNSVNAKIKGDLNGNFISEVPAGKNKSIDYKMTFDKPISIGIEYVSAANSNELLDSNTEYIISTDINKTITVLNPDNQLSIDTNYDGIYENGVTQFSSFEIRFRLNSVVPLAAGKGTFKLQSYLTNTLQITHKNLTDIVRASSVKIFAVCIPRDSDSDGIPDFLDIDSDNDGIQDLKEFQGTNTILPTNLDVNENGLDDAYESEIAAADTDLDGISDFLDLDTDNDGILDSVEKDSDFDNDRVGNYRDLDSDNDKCNDVIEAGFTDIDGDGKFGDSPINVDSKGQVIGATYSSPLSNYLISAPIEIITQPVNTPSCELESAVVFVVDNGGSTYQWQLSTDGVNWNNLTTNNANYLGITTSKLSINRTTAPMDGFKYRVQLSKIGNSCGLISAISTLTVNKLPVVKDITIVQCDDDLDQITSFNLTVKNDQISSDSAKETFTYFKSRAGADSANVLEEITTPPAFINTTPATMDVWARVANKNGCYRVAKMTLHVVATKIQSLFNIKLPPLCDDFLDLAGNNTTNNDKHDGIATFDLSATKITIQAQLPKTDGVDYTIKYYRNEPDALAEINPITSIAKYRNIGYPNKQDIWVRVDSNISNDCYGLGPFVSLTVEENPFANTVTIPRQCDDDQDGKFNFDTSSLESTLKGTNQSFQVTINYFDSLNNPLQDANGLSIKSPFPNRFTTKSQTIKAVVTNKTTLKCSDETAIEFVIDNLPKAFSIPVSLTTICDDDLDPMLQDGQFSFDTSSFESTILKGQPKMNVNYFDDKGQILPHPLPNPFITGTKNVTVVVENQINPKCSTPLTIPFIVNARPKIRLQSNPLEYKSVCKNNPLYSVRIDAGILDGTSPSEYTFVWKKDGEILPTKINYTIDVAEEGLYTVEVKNKNGCTSTRAINVIASDVATIDSINISDLNDKNNTVEINVSGIGEYEFNLDDPKGFFQDSGFFENVSPGFHEVFIRDKNGCGPISKTFSVIGIPKFFTPNGDGFNDYWNVKGVNTTNKNNSIIYLHDRYGKLIKQWEPSRSVGWDGKLNGFPMPIDDYWFKLILSDGREIKGNFTLKR